MFPGEGRHPAEIPVSPQLLLEHSPLSSAASGAFGYIQHWIMIVNDGISLTDYLRDAFYKLDRNIGNISTELWHKHSLVLNPPKP